MQWLNRMALVGVAILWMSSLVCAQAQPMDLPKGPVAKVDKSGAIIVPLQGSVRLQMKSKKLIKTVYIDKETTIQALADALKPDTVIIQGRAVGSSTIELTDVDGGKESYEVIVEQDVDLLRSLIKRAVPTASVDILPGVGGAIILSGNVAHAEDVNIILQLASSIAQNGNVINALQVGGVHQVQLDVVVAQVNRTKARSRGFNFIVNGSTVSLGSILGGLATSTSGANSTTSAASGVGILPSAASVSPSASANLILGIVPANFQGLLQALKTEGLAKTLAEPRLVTQSGRPASFLAGGQQATLSAASGINGPGVTYQSIGTQLDFIPIVYGNGKIYLEVNPTIRGVNQGLGIVTSFGTVPGFDVQTVRTSVVLESGQTFAIGGLIQNQVSASVAKVPVLGDIPFLGAAFSVITQSETEQELVILVTPHLVDAMDCKQLPTRLPGRETRAGDDYEFFLESMVELPRGQRNVFVNRRYRGAWKNDPSAAQFPCTNNMATGGIGGNGGNCANGSCATGVRPVGDVAPVGNSAPGNLPPTVPGTMPPPAQMPPLSSGGVSEGPRPSSGVIQDPSISVLPVTPPGNFGNSGGNMPDTP